ncbi:hypothetical protein QJQ45_019730 [Haematococcus lacustris]|nr:hypothetical protein QJQ45_019730 [Haematococcus lacustris]
MPAAFPVPNVVPNDDGWGPNPSAVPAHLADVPFAPFGKGDKIGRASDWTQAAYQKYPGRGYQQGAPTAVFNFFHNEEEENFHVVDSRPVKAPKFGQRRFPPRFQGGRGRGDRNDPHGQEPQGGRTERLGTKKQEARKQPWQNFGRDQQRTIYSSSVDIKPEWAVIEQINFPALGKLHCSVGEPEDVMCCGELEYYDKAFDRVTVKAETPLEKTKRAFRNVTTSDDPIMRKLAAEHKATVFATDTILTTLMCMRSSKYSWDLLVTKIGGKLFFDKRANSNLNLLTVNETAQEEVPEEKDNINGVQHLAIEATTINQNFSQQWVHGGERIVRVLVKGGEKFKYDAPNPFTSPEEEEELASCAYRQVTKQTKRQAAGVPWEFGVWCGRYRKWRLNEESELDIVVRCEVDGMINNKGEDQLLSIKALNEFDMRAQDWRKKVESQRGAVLAFETKNNKYKMAKWTASALLAGADIIKLGYVSRVGPRDNINHVILATQVCKPKDFAGSINLSMDHCWGIVRALVELFMKQEDGKFLLVKDPMKELLRVYSIPDDAFATEADYADLPTQ